MDHEKIGKFIAKLRKEMGMTQAELGEMLGVSYKAVSKWETGRNLPDPALYKPLCAALGITLTELFSGEKIEKEHIIEKSDQVISDVMENSNGSTAMQIVSAAATVSGALLLFVPALFGFSRTASVVIISVGLLFIFIGMSVKMSAWRLTSGKTVKNTGMGFTSGLTLLFVGFRLAGLIDWPWIWVISPLWIGFAAVILFLAVIFIIGRIKKKW